MEEFLACGDNYRSPLPVSVSKCFNVRPPKFVADKETGQNHANCKNNNGNNRFIPHFTSASISKPHQRMLGLLLLFILTANGFIPGGSSTTMRHITQNNTTIKRNTAHKSTHTIHTIHNMN
jgi:hypothetical protein